MDASGRAALEWLRNKMKGDTQKNAEKVTKHAEKIKVLRQYTNPFGVSITKYDIGEKYSYPLGQWPFDHKVLIQGLINLLVSDEPRIIRFWKHLASVQEAQMSFIFGLQGLIEMWAYSKIQYETTASEFKHKAAATISDLKSLMSKFQESQMLSDVADDEISQIFHDGNYVPFQDRGHSGNVWDENPLRMLDLLAKILHTVERESHRDPFFPIWYPTKITGKSSDKIFLIKTLHLQLKTFGSKPSHVLIADMASVILDDVITEDDVRKNLPEKLRKIPPRNRQ